MAEANNTPDAKESGTVVTESTQYIGVDLSYSVNKKAHSLIATSEFDDFCSKSAVIRGGVDRVTKVVSFGDDHYGLLYSTDSDNQPQPQPQPQGVTGFLFTKGAYRPLPSPVQSALRPFTKASPSSTDLIISNTPSGREVVLFDNTSSKFRTIDLFEKAKDNNSAKDAFKKPAADESDLKNGDTEDNAEDNAEPAANTDEDKPASKESTPKFKVKSSISAVWKHLLLTANGSLYGLSGAFHKKYINNKKVSRVACDGSRCALILDEQGVVWSFGINLFGKLGLPRNDKKQMYTNPREIAIFKAYKCVDLGITNRCCVAVCKNGDVYGWGAFSKSALGTDSQIWYTPRKISEGQRTQWRVWAGFRFVLLLNVDEGRLWVANTEFGYTLLDEPRNGLMVATEEIKLSKLGKGVRVHEVVPSSETAMIIARVSG